MHFVTGGAFNGKSKWITEYYHLKDTPHLWISCHKHEHAPLRFDDHLIIILEGIELMLKDLSAQSEISEARKRWQRQLSRWMNWENENPRRKIILIGTDMNKGIVPMLAEDRKWRDLTGWAYQDAVRAACRADLIWYGISQRLK
ncbi:bifunctional adenosylcobinamide kinase/adenosylcobinamide-phosphate guanylyltransferase [Bacillus sp. DTU_2020_1000418_1_SI_GHA_SEK_038]|uniref:bifunctional adenosylcobinamide kinase/adenosylcobinamide-phosphate guanylyltransferase n=1 Tax=Bacillus sp. DTU_2020_1000418_1_SI_GHA_SEK_038 TaxID=3077585 RepID=UPI0028F0C584|nr:bifunctional adenosylcobinamide kinase/adenosylcobinamide-phosphate guanylyltransferase [Bacillus sp. DTU_2020_1000418_1_SI_GHA_SEK_038]WNS75916.1 bifunctional adenosylcobinamide kinase/adenosylcobinamide-phosphate guanylyltransferase [Bacillus sp. DTU_2020_1000418_1_SI_GHA_SEK_038]